MFLLASAFPSCSVGNEVLANPIFGSKKYYAVVVFHKDFGFHLITFNKNIL